VLTKGCVLSTAYIKLQLQTQTYTLTPMHA
jgi:hypothetical protein